jgi:16S rRNA (guanine(966)-N(2))-methyltransferase RsmD
MSLKIETGYLRGLSFDTVNSKNTRYTPAQLRRTLANIFDFSDCKVLEIFGGSGSFSFEAISNDASDSTIIEASSKAVMTIKSNIKKLNIDEKINVIKKDYRAAVLELVNEKKSFDIIFADPPFNLNFCNEFLSIMDENFMIFNENCYLILEKSKHENCDIELKNIFLEETRNYGDIDINIYKRK